ncbi:hypothetical protein QT381_02540 [Galbitalea sp. SE-J8]|uniref:hypothetical protein n=1 Tax=Galbitalea sp. SE-J8 TaxID=3054952 RepID=UPI00259D0E28|nr:hypothetical protein [Galbitalea sp. SE-J8]MDM4761881.1 hypothetical protein [Galbitalea sp. SE-J8]
MYANDSSEAVALSTAENRSNPAPNAAFRPTYPAVTAAVDAISLPPAAMSRDAIESPAASMPFIVDDAVRSRPKKSKVSDLLAPGMVRLSVQLLLVRRLGNEHAPPLVSDGACVEGRNVGEYRRHDRQPLEQRPLDVVDVC